MSDMCELCARTIGRDLAYDGVHVSCLAARQMLTTLAHNLAIGAALCRAFSQGAYAVGTALPYRAVAYVDADRVWTPGCGKAAP